MTVSDEGVSTLKERAKKKLARDLGPLIMDALADPKTTDIMLNADGKVWQKRLGEEMQCVGSMSFARGEAIIKTVAGYHGKEVTREKPLLEGELPIDGSRFAGQLPPVVAAPTFAIRKRAIAIFTLDDYVTDGIMTAAQRDALMAAIQAHRTIMITGGTGSGKTTLANAIIKAMVVCFPHERMSILEYTGEIQCGAENFLQYHTSLEVTMSMLLVTTLVMNPHRIFVGEVRGPEALDLLMACNTGHPGGAATLHANSAEEGLDRLVMLVSMHPNCPKSIEPLIARAVDVIVHIAETPQGRRVEEIIEVCGYENGRFITRPL